MPAVSPLSSRLRVLLIALCLLPLAGRARAPDPETASIRSQVEQLAAAGGAMSALTDFYRQRQYAPAWTRPATVDQLLAALAGTASDGLDPEDYGLSRLKAMRAALADDKAAPAQRARFDLRATDAYLAALVQLYRGKVAPVTLDPHWNFEERPLDPAQDLQAAIDAVDSGRVAELFARARPQDPLYDRLRDALARLRAVAQRGGWPGLPDGPTLKPGMRDARVPLLRQRLVAGGYLPAGEAAGERYDATLEAAVKQFQRDQYLAADGGVGAATRAALNVTANRRVDQLRVNLERARWLMHEVQGDFVVVDIAGYKVSYYKDGKSVWSSRVQVGKPYRSTPVFKSRITYITLNPTWTVPPTILKHDIVPKIRADPGYLAANRIRVLDSKGQLVPPRSVNWNNPRGIVLRQDAGPGNSLGRLVIRFPNPYAVYLHDTPHQELFGASRRDFSSGCIRVQHARELAVLLLGDPAKWDRVALDRAIDTGRTQTVNLARPVPLLLAYWTVHLHRDGRVSYRPDIYQRDGRLLAALDRRRVSPLDALPGGAP
ncbi:L,D-transpeptidase family protein [Rhodanobacter aciditrophus]|uniref:L,D-transpeptidase family protein n=1 Tax=Rhodanobacter aciditrophus TaxID=1623218 RepID=UPI003CF6FE87